MQQFVAILKDSFREAVDGFVIYAMLAMSALVILLLGSISFTPEPPQEALDYVAKQFVLVFPDKGLSRSISASFENNYRAADVQPQGNGYKLRVLVSANRRTPRDEPGEVGGKVEKKAEKVDKPSGDSFRETVVAWSRPPGQVREVQQG